MRPLLSVISFYFFSLCLFSSSFAASGPVASPDSPVTAGSPVQAQKGEKPSPAEENKVKEPPRSLELVGAEGRKIEITMDAPLKRHLPVKVKNLAKDSMTIKAMDLPLRRDGETVTARLVPVGGKGKEAALSEESASAPVTLKPGEVRTLELSLGKDLSMGSYTGTLVFRDNEGGHVQEFDLTIKNPYLTIRCPYLLNLNRYPEIFVFIFVSLGALISLFLAKFPAVSSSKGENREKITDLRERIRRLTAFEKDLGTKLTVELVKAETLNTNTKVYTPSATERFKAIEAQLNKIDEQLRIRQEISNRYVEIDSADYLTFSMEQQIRSLLRAADQGLYMDRPDLAEAGKKEAEGLLKCEASILREQVADLVKEATEFLNKKDLEQSDDTYLRDRRMELDRKLTALLQELEVTRRGDDTNELSKEVRERLKKRLKDGQPFADEADKRAFLRRMREADLSFNRAKIYSYFFDLTEKPSRAGGCEISGERQEEIRRLISSDVYKDLEYAGTVIESLEMGVCEDTIKDALTNKEFSLVTIPSDPTVNNLVRFRLTFSNGEINKSPLVKTAGFRYIWDFGDETSRAEGDEVIHYFKRRGILILFRKLVRRNLSVLKLRKAEWKRFTLSLEVLGPDGATLATRKEKVSVRETLDREYSSGITITAFMGFALTLLISTVVAMTTTYEETYSFRSLKDVLAPFLLGFGLDISREKLLEAAKGFGSKKGKA